MTLPYAIPAQTFERTYSDIRALLNGHDDLIFEAMAAITADSPNPFSPPIVAGNTGNKHREILQWLRSSATRSRENTALHLFQKIYERALSRATEGNIDIVNLLSLCCLETELKLNLNLSSDSRWVIRWRILHLHYFEDVALDVYEHTVGSIVPTYIIQFYDRAIDAYQKRMPVVAVALLSIAVEATLRDALAEHGYSGGSGLSFPVYGPVEAAITAGPASYDVRFIGLPVKPVADFNVAAGTTSGTTVQIRRRQRPKSNKWELVVRPPDWMIDFWSSDTIEQPASNSIGGLGHALRVARDIEIVTPQDLPLDLDPVLQLVRNNTVHISGPSLNAASNAGDIQTIHEFLSKPVAVFDTMHTIGRFINSQYLRMRDVIAP